MKKLLSVVMAMLVVLSVVGCSNNSEGADSSSTGKGSSKKTEVTFLGTIKPEVADVFEDALKAYNKSQDKYEVVSIPLDGNAFEKMTALYASGNAPTIVVTAQEAKEFKDKFLDLSDQPLLQKAQQGSYDLVTFDGKVVGFPVTVEAFGLLYNQAVLDEAVGGTFDPKTINSQSSLEDLFKKIETTGKAGSHISPLDWSLGLHLGNLYAANQSENADDVLAFLDSLQSGNANLAENEVFNGWLDTFDLLMAYNERKSSPLSPSYDEGAIALADGDAGVWFQGNWTVPMLAEVNPDAQIGILPYPVSDNGSDFGNSKISVGVPLYFSVDAAQSSVEQQEGAIDFITWLFTSEEGSKYYVEKMKLIPVYEGITAQPEELISRQVVEYMNNGETLEWFNMYYPGDAGAALGATMQKYLSGAIDRAGLINEFEAYWNNK